MKLGSNEVGKGERELRIYKVFNIQIPCTILVLLLLYFILICLLLFLVSFRFEECCRNGGIHYLTVTFIGSER